MVQSAHDALFKNTFGQVRHARPFLKHVMRPEIANAIQWSTLKLRPGSFVDDSLKDSHTDLLFSVRLRRDEILLYVLFEHQSSVDRWMPLRLLEYMVRIWRAHALAHPDSKGLPFVLPIVLHHSAAGWTADTRFEALLLLDDELREELLRYAPRFEFALDDVSRASDGELRARAVTALGRLVLACFRHARDMRTLLANVHAWQGTMREVRAAPHGVHAMKTVLSYIVAVTRNLDDKEILALVEAAGDPGLTEEIMTLAERWKEEGRAEGEARARADVLQRLLRAKFGKVPARAAAQIKAADASSLDRWIERILSASKLSDVLEG